MHVIREVAAQQESEQAHPRKSLFHEEEAYSTYHFKKGAWFAGHVSNKYI